MVGRKHAEQPNVFISHSHVDRAIATKLQRVLHRHGAETYLDQDRIQVADDLPDRIREGITWCNTFLLIWSSNAAASDWVQREWDAAYDLRKKIIPYCLDAASLPFALENLVYIDYGDQKHSHAYLLKAVFGRDFRPDPSELFPGHWRVKCNALGMASATYNLELRANGQIIGDGKIDEGGLLGGLLQLEGMSNLLNTSMQIDGNWSYEEGTQILTLDTTAYGFGQQQHDIIRIKTTGEERGEIHGQDLGGRSYIVKRIL